MIKLKNFNILMMELPFVFTEQLDIRTKNNEFITIKGEYYERDRRN